MTRPTGQRWLVALLAGASLGTTALVAINVVSRRSHQTTSFGRLDAKAIDHRSDSRTAVLMTLPPFSLIEQSGSAFGSRQLRGKVWIADFVFTRCAGPCPMMTAQMAQLQDQLNAHRRRNDIQLVSFTVDPDHDTPAVLSQYAQRAGADPQRWRFLTGNRSDIWNLVRNGFKLPVDQDTSADSMPIIHSQKFVLVDERGRVRGFYDALEHDDQARLRADIDRVLEDADTERSSQTLSPDEPGDGSAGTWDRGRVHGMPTATRQNDTRMAFIADRCQATPWPETDR